MEEDFNNKMSKFYSHVNYSVTKIPLKFDNPHPSFTVT